jgi:HAE1 family hydrophobic/amphiphilic exporter-1
MSERVRTVMESMSSLADVEATLQTGAPEIQVVYDRDRLSRYGLNIMKVAQMVRDKVQGHEATRFNLLDRRVPILVRLNENERETVNDVEGLVVNPEGERPITLGSVAKVEVGEGPSEVRRVDGRRVALVRANLNQGSLSEAVGSIQSELHRQVDWPAGMGFYISGQSEEWERSKGSLYLALGLSIFLVYVIMAIQFESLLHPLVVMFSIPLAFLGTVVVLKLLGFALSVVVFLGMIMLAGIVVNNAIVLVDYVNQLRRRGMEMKEAIVQAGSVRLRPILMTTATTVLGLLPMAVGLGDGSEIRTPMAVSVISGLLSSTILTLLVIPSLYLMLDSLVSRIRERVTGSPALGPAESTGGES